MNIKDIRIRDPYIIKENDFYYLIGTTNKTNFVGYKSKDLVEFTGPFILFDTIENNMNTSCAWAPEIHKINGVFYMIFTLKPKNSHRSCYIASSKNIFGKYELITKVPITPKDWECLDGSIAFDKDYYLIFCREWTEVENGEIYACKLSADFTKLIGVPKLLFRATDAKWSTKIAEGGYITDGPFVFKQNNKFKMLWSSFYKENYALSVISSNSLLGKWEQEEVPFIKNDGGHGMLFKDNGRIKLALHYPNKKPFERLKIIDFDSDKDYEIF